MPYCSFWYWMYYYTVIYPSLPPLGAGRAYALEDPSSFNRCRWGLWLRCCSSSRYRWDLVSGTPLGSFGCRQGQSFGGCSSRYRQNQGYGSHGYGGEWLGCWEAAPRSLGLCRMGCRMCLRGLGPREQGPVVFFFLMLFLEPLLNYWID